MEVRYRRQTPLKLPANLCSCNNFTELFLGISRSFLVCDFSTAVCFQFAVVICRHLPLAISANVLEISCLFSSKYKYLCLKLDMQFFDISEHKMICSKGDFTENYDTEQINGQLISTLKCVRHPKRGTEIFMKNIPRDALLQDILEFVIHCGDIYQIRLLMDFSGFNRGYCFVTYLGKQAARKAAVILNGNKIKSCAVTVKLSFDNNKLEMRGMPPGIKRSQVFATMSEIVGDGLQEILTFRNGRNVCVLKYDTHRNALEARRKVWPRLMLWSRQIEIDWAIPREVLSSKRLYFRNLPAGTTKLQLYDEVTKYVKPETLLNMFLQDELGYFLLISDSAANEALNNLRVEKICGTTLEFSFSRFVNRLPVLP